MLRNKRKKILVVILIIVFIVLYFIVVSTRNKNFKGGFLLNGVTLNALFRFNGGRIYFVSLYKLFKDVRNKFNFKRNEYYTLIAKDTGGNVLDYSILQDGYSKPMLTSQVNFDVGYDTNFQRNPGTNHSIHLQVYGRSKLDLINDRCSVHNDNQYSVKDPHNSHTITLRFCYYDYNTIQLDTSIYQDLTNHLRVQINQNHNGNQYLDVGDGRQVFIGNTSRIIDHTGNNYTHAINNYNYNAPTAQGSRQTFTQQGNVAVSNVQQGFASYI